MGHSPIPDLNSPKPKALNREGAKVAKGSLGASSGACNFLRVLCGFAV